MFLKCLVSIKFVKSMMIAVIWATITFSILTTTYGQDSANGTESNANAVKSATTVATPVGTTAGTTNQINLCLNSKFERSIPSPGGCTSKADCENYGDNYFCENISDKKFCCPKPQSKNTAACEDESSDCEMRAQDCINSHFYSMMSIKCKKTCNRCSICKDIEPDCPQRKGYCNNEVYRDLMAWQCPITCNLCNRPRPSKGTKRSAIYSKHALNLEFQ